MTRSLQDGVLSHADVDVSAIKEIVEDFARNGYYRPTGARTSKEQARHTISVLISIELTSEELEGLSETEVESEVDTVSSSLANEIADDVGLWHDDNFTIGDEGESAPEDL